MKIYPTPSPTTPASPANQAPTMNNPPLPDLSAPYRGWYPRWWLLSAIFCSIATALFIQFQPIICSLRSSTSPLCQIDSWTDWREFAVVAVIWMIFLLGWLVALVYGFSTIEVSRQHRTGIATVLRAMSEFKTIYGLIYIFSTVAFFSIVVCWYLNWYRSIVFGYTSIVVFVGATCFMYRCTPEARRVYLVGTGIFAIISAIIMLWIGPIQPVIFATEMMIASAGIWRLFRRPRPTAQAATLTPLQILAAKNANAITPGAVFMALFSASFRRNPPAAQTNPNQPNQPNLANQPNQPDQPNQPNQQPNIP
jgi:MFS family permease